MTAPWLPLRQARAAWGFLCLCLGVSAHAETATAPPPVRELAAILRAQRSSSPVFFESFSEDLRQWGFPRRLGPDGMALALTGGTVPGVAQIFVPGLILRDGAISCQLRLAAGDQGLVMFRANEDADTAYQLVVRSGDPERPLRFVKRRGLDQIYGGSAVGYSYPVPVPAGAWVPIEIYFQGRILIALAGGIVGAYYDRADSQEGSVSVIGGSSPLHLRDLAVSTFFGEEPRAPYALSRPAAARVFRKPGAEIPLYVDAEGAVYGPRRGRDRAEYGTVSPRLPRIPLAENAPASPLAQEGAGAPFLPGSLLPAGPPDRRGDLVGGTLPSLRGGVHSWRLEPDNRFFLDGEPLVPLRDTDGVYWAQLPADLDRRRAVQSISDAGILARVRASGLPWAPVRVRLVDYFNAVGTSHDLSEDPVLEGRSRVLAIAGRNYRVTSARRWLSYFAFTLRTPEPLRPHLLLAETPNDRERVLTLRIHPPDGAGSDPDYGVGAGVFTGRGLPCDNRPFNAGLLFAPRSEQVRVTVSRMPGEERSDRLNGAAVSQVFLFALVDRPEARPNPVFPPLDAEERVLSLSVPSARALLRQCGAGLDAPHTPPAARASGYRGFVHYLRFLGFNGVDLGILDIGDERVATEYVGSRVVRNGTDRGVFSEFLPVATSAGIRVTPVVPPLPLSPDLIAFGQQAPGFVGETVPEWAAVNRVGQAALAGRWPVLDLLHPGAAAAASELLREVASRFLVSGCRDVALRVDGDTGGCIPRAGLLRAEETGYSAADVTRFASETGIAVPGETAAARYEWLRANAWDRWLEWRCRALQAHWNQARDILRSYRNDSRLILKIAAPDRELARPDAWFEEKRLPHDLLRAHGVDPRAFVDNDTFLLERTLDVGYDRLRAARHRENTAALDSFPYQTTFSDLFKGKAPGGVEIAFAPWAEHGQHLGSEFFPRRGTHWGESTMTPWGRWLFRPATSALRNGNPYRLSLSSIEFATAGREHDWRRFARAFRALPAVDPTPFAGQAYLLPPEGKPGNPAPLPGDLLVRTYGLRIGIINDSGQARRIALTPAREAAPGERWVDLASGDTLARGGQDTGPLTLTLDAFDLRVLALLPDAGPRRAL